MWNRDTHVEIRNHNHEETGKRDKKKLEKPGERKPYAQQNSQCYSLVSVLVSKEYIVHTAKTYDTHTSGKTSLLIIDSLR